MENNFLPNQAPKKTSGSGNVKKFFLTTVAALGMTGLVSAQDGKKNVTEKDPQATSLQQDSTHSQPEGTVNLEGNGPTPELDIDSLYNQNKEQFDSYFNNYSSLENLPATTSVVIQSQVGSIVIKVKNFSDDSAHTLLSKEEFNSIEDLDKKYPQYTKSVRELNEKSFNDHKESMVWNQILSEKEKTLANDFETYVPSQEERDILAWCVEVKNNGGTTDGYDEIYHFYVGKFKSPQDRYDFYTKYNGRPEELASHMINKYYKPFLK